MIRTTLLLLVASSLCAQQQAKLDQAKTLFENRKYAEAKKILASVDDEQKEFAEAQFYLGRIAFDEKDYDDAADFFEEAVEANAKVAAYHNWLGNTYGTIARDANPLRQGILAPKMKSAWEQAVALAPNEIEPRKSLIEYYTQAPGFMGGSFEKAHATAKQIKKLNLAEGHLAAGRIYSREEKFVEAEKEFVAMAKANPEYTNGLISFYVSQKNYDKAFLLYDEALTKNPSDMLVTYQLGRLCALSGKRLEAGEANLKKYLTYQPKVNEPSHAAAHMRLGNIYEKMGKKSEAKKSYEISLKMDATMKEATEGLARVR